MPSSEILPGIFTIKTRYVNLFMVTHQETCLCIDTGLNASTSRKEFTKLGLHPAAVTHVFLTHTDQDHTGGLDLFPQAAVYLSALEEQMINGTTKRSWLVRNPKLSRPYRTLADGEVIQIGTMSVHALSTPGHTPGSMSYVVNGQYLFAGDTVELKGNVATLGMKWMNMDGTQQMASLQKLAQLRDIVLLCTAHSGVSHDFPTAMKPWKT
jgi:hydroxyacylglutathione hydrolase